jgi:phosphatidylglycerol:prolipoprotein diacylglycerol transferase
MGLPYFDIPPLGPVQPFGIIVAIGVLIGASMMRRYAERFGVDDDDLRGLIGWVAVTGFIGAHVFDVLAYQHAALREDPLVLIKLWQGISSYGGFLGGALGFAFFVWWKRLTPGLWADATAVGLLVAFSIGRVACTVVHDHIGAPTDFALGFDYPWHALVDRRIHGEFVQAPMIRAHNLGFYELLYLIPVNAAVLWLAFKAKVRPAGFITVVMGALYAPVRFFLEYLRLDQSDPRYAGLTFAQWCSVAAFAIAVYAAIRIWRHGQVAPLAAELDGRPGGKKASIAAAKANERVRSTDKERAKATDKLEKKKKKA